jgi:hypothetical protein
MLLLNQSFSQLQTSWLLQPALQLSKQAVCCSRQIAPPSHHPSFLFFRSTVQRTQTLKFSKSQNQHRKIMGKKWGEKKTGYFSNGSGLYFR